MFTIEKFLVFWRMNIDGLNTILFFTSSSFIECVPGSNKRVKSRGTNVERNVEVTKTFLNSRSSFVAAYFDIELPVDFNLLHNNKRLKVLGHSSFCCFGKLKNGEPILFRTFRSHLTKMHRKQSSWL
jgi:hypothetical protein